MARLPKIQLSNLFLLLVCCAILTAWYKDRTQLLAKYGPRKEPNAGAHWETHQATGKPNTPGAGDITTAWASSTQDGQKEWLIADYGKAITAKSIEVHETFNPGAVYQISGFNDPKAKETILWQGTDPAPPGAVRSVSVFPINAKQKYRYYKIYIDSPSVAGWNEIDAIGVQRGRWRSTKWAVDVQASSCYANGYASAVMSMQVAPTPSAKQPQLEALEKPKLSR